MSVFATATASIPRIHGEDGALLTEPFLDVCRLVLPIVDKLGTAFTLVRTDINGNITRLADRASTDPERYRMLFTIIQDEMVSKSQASSTSCSKGLLWLKRAMEFTVAIVQQLMVDETASYSLSRIVGDTYAKTLQPYHGFIASSAFTLAFRFVPSRESFMESLGHSPTLPQEMAAFVTDFGAVLQEIHAFLEENGLNDPSKV